MRTTNKIAKPTQKLISEGIQKLVRQWKRTGRIETTRAVYKPKTLKEAMAQAAAIEYGRQRRMGKKIPRK